MTKYEGGAHGEVSIATVGKIMEIAAAQTCGDNLHLDVTCYRGPYVAILDPDVAGTI
jgi:hypothetical protein